jgi:hypothetical protein
MRNSKTLVEEAFASSCTTQARNAVQTANLALELVVISQLFVCMVVSTLFGNGDIDSRAAYSEQCRAMRK